MVNALDSRSSSAGMSPVWGDYMYTVFLGKPVFSLIVTL